MMALQVGLGRAVKPAAIVGYSGMLARGVALEPLPPDTPPILLVHGDADQMIPAQAMLASAMMLGEAGAGGAVAHRAGRRPRHRSGRAPDGRRLPGPGLSRSAPPPRARGLLPVK
ncbi:MAG: hypothetical protein WDM81_16750 [Rhizomicrobium sp.]